jgi:putative oxidoreductase
MDTVLLVVRLFLGLGLAAHGLQKLAGWYGGYGLKATGEFVVKLGFPSGRLFAAAAGLGETTGGLLTALGLFGPFGPAMMMITVLTASVTVHAKNGFFAQNNGVELPMLYAMGALLLAFAGPGTFSLDSVFGLLRLWNDRVAGIAVGLAVIVAVGNIMISRAAARRTAPST